MKKELFNWNEEAISLLRDLWAHGLSASEIGNRMGLNKNAIIGKAHSLNLKKRKSSTGIIIDRSVIDPQVAEMRRDEKTIAEIANNLHISGDSVRAAFVRLGMTFKKKLETRRVVREKFGKRSAEQIENFERAVVAINSFPVVRVVPKPKLSPTPKPKSAPEFFFTTRTRPGDQCCFCSETGIDAPGKRWMYCDAAAEFGAYCAKHAVGLTVQRRSNRDAAT